MIQRVFTILFFCSIIIGCKSHVERIAEITNKSKEIRVKLKLNNEISVTLDDYLVIMESENKKRFSFPYKTNKITIRNYNEENFINNIKFNEPITLYAKYDRFIRINDQLYLGKINIIPQKKEIEIINTIPIETYLLSVVLSEMPINFPIEALKSQSVIARTYSFYFINKYRETRNFDVDNTVMYQVYNGFNLKLDTNQLNKIKRALFDTKNQIIIYEEKPIIAYFHSNSGGMLRSGLDYFGKASDFPYLQAKNDPYSSGEKNDKWTYKIDFTAFKNKIGITNNLTDDIKEELFSYNAEGFVNTFNYDNKNVLTAKEIRKRVGYFELKSERFKVSIENNNLILNGIGFGHGVGLSQYGAKKMAEKGFNYKKIIDFYYPGTKIFSYR